jgi:hypothetical protein
VTPRAAPEAIDPRRLLRERAEAAIEDVRQAEDALVSTPISPALAERVEIDFADALLRHRNELNAVLESVTGGEPADACWRQLDDARSRGRPLLAECLAYVDGALARSHGIAADVCELADQLLADVARRTSSGWGRFTILAEGEFVGDLARIVRLRFPEAGVWSLPIALHELGHHVMPRLGPDPLDGTGARPFAEMLAAAEAAGEQGDALLARRAWHHLHELLADAFASYAGGPAFAFACAFLRFLPQSSEDRRHPAASARMHAIMRGLDRLDDSPAFSDTIDDLREMWAANLEAAGAVPLLDDPVFDARIDRIHELLEDNAPSARFDGWFRAEQLVPRLETKDSDGGALDPRLRPWDVVNAGWLARFRRPRDPYQLRDLAARTGEACRAVLAAP